MSDRKTIIGIDPGLSSVGVARIQCDRTGKLHCIGLNVVTSKKAGKKARLALRVCADDMRRVRECWGGIIDQVPGYPNCHDVDAVAYEVYQPRPGRGASGSKTLMVCGLAMALGFTLGVPVYPVLPQDVKREAVGRDSGSKDDVSEALCDRIVGLREKLERITKGQREHASDAAGIAAVGFQLLEGY